MRAGRMLLLLVSMLAVSASAVADTYPTKPIRWVVPFAPGGSSDASARPIATLLGAELGQPVVVENRPGAGAIVGSDFVAKAPADGYTLLLVPGTHTLGKYLSKNLPYDPVKDFTPIGRMVSVPYVLVTGPKQPFASLPELIAFGSRQDKGFSFGTTDVLGMLTVELLKSVGNTKVVQINYKGAPAIVTDVLGGHLDAGATTPPVVKGFSQDKNGLRMLAVTSARRSPSLPDVPTVAELTGIASFEVATWYGIAGPAGLPAPIAERIERALMKVMKDPELRTRLVNMGVDVIEDNSARAMAATMLSNADQWGALAEKAGIKP